MVKRFGLGRREKLKSRKEIEMLFTEGQTIAFTPLRVLYRFSPAPGRANMKIAVSASKRNFKKAVDRNRIKRLIREAYRQQKESLLNLTREQQLEGMAFFMFTNKSIPNFETVKTAMASILQKMEQQISGAK